MSEAKGNILDILKLTADKIHEIADPDAVVGDPIVIGDVTVIPVSKASYGFAGGGSDLPNKSNPHSLAGGAGAKADITPQAFLVVNGDEVRLITEQTESENHEDSSNSILDTVFDIVPKLFKKIGKNKEDGNEDVKE